MFNNDLCDPQITRLYWTVSRDVEDAVPYRLPSIKSQTAIIDDGFHFFINGEEVTKIRYFEFRDEHEAKEEVEWYAFSDENPSDDVVCRRVRRSLGQPILNTKGRQTVIIISDFIKTLTQKNIGRVFM